MKTIKILALIMLCACSILSVKAQYSVQSAFEKIRFINLPYEAGKNNARIQSVGIAIPNQVIPNKLYKDFQCTDYVLASSDPELSPILFGKFRVSNSNWVIGAVTFGGATDLQSTSLIVVDKQGNIKSVLESEIQFGLIAAKQFRIASDGKVIITKLVPTSSTSVKFDNFNQISAYRVDETYSINSSGVFVKEGEKKYGTKNYSKSQLDTMNNDLWDL